MSQEQRSAQERWSQQLGSEFIKSMLGPVDERFVFRPPGPAVERDLDAAVYEQLAAINDSLPPDWRGIVEVEPIPPERTDTYDVALGSAIKNCDHSRSSHGTSHSRGERQCDDCGRYFTKRSWYE